jgi:MFS family permease
VQTSAVELLRGNRPYRRLWLAEAISFFGDWFNQIALYAIVFELSGTGRAVAGVLVARTLPVFLVAPLAGPLVDRVDRRRLMIASDVGRALLACVLVLAHHLRSLPLLFVTITAMVGLTGFFFPARNAAIPQLTRDHELATANALSGSSWSVMLALGAAMGGWVTAAIGVDAALLLDGLTFLVSAALLFRLPPLPAPAAHEEPRSGGFVGGLRHVYARPYMLALASLKPLMGLSGGVIALIPILGTTTFPGKSGPIWVGALYFARGLGALVGSMGLLRLFGGESRALRRVLLGAFALIGASYAWLAGAASFEHAALAIFAGAIGNGAVWVMSSLLIQREGDRRFLGRIFSLEFGAMTLTFSASGWIAGSMIDAGAGTPRTIAWSAAAMLLPIVLWGAVLLGAGAPGKTRGPRAISDRLGGTSEPENPRRN